MHSGRCFPATWIAIGAALVLGAITTPANADAPPSNPWVFLTERWIDYNGHFQIEIQNLDRRGSVTSFTWKPPPSLTVTAVASVQGGSCSLGDDGAVSCTGVVSSPQCGVGSKTHSTANCRPAPGGSVIINITATLSGAVPGATFTQNLFTAPYWQQLQITGWVTGAPQV